MGAYRTCRNLGTTVAKISSVFDLQIGRKGNLGRPRVDTSRHRPTQAGVIRSLVWVAVRATRWAESGAGCTPRPHSPRNPPTMLPGPASRNRDNAVMSVKVGLPSSSNERLQTVEALQPRVEAHDAIAYTFEAVQSR